MAEQFPNYTPKENLPNHEGREYLLCWFTPGYSGFHISVLLVAAVMSGILTSSWNYLLEPILMSDAFEASYASVPYILFSIIGFVVTPLVIVMSICTGLSADQMSFRAAYAAGFVILALTYFFCFFIDSSTAIFSMRIAFWFGSSITTVMILVYAISFVQDVSRGKITCLVVVCLMLGPLVFRRGFQDLPSQIQGLGLSPLGTVNAVTLALIGLCIAIAGLVYFGLATVKTPGVENRTSTQLRPSIGQSIVTGFRNPRLRMVYSGAFVLMANTQLLSFAMQMRYELFRFDTAYSREAINAMNTTSHEYLFAGTIVGTILFGIVCDRIRRESATALAAAITAAACITMLVISNPIINNDFMWIAAMTLGLGGGSAYISILTFLGQEAPRERLAIMVGLFSAIGAAGAGFLRWLGLQIMGESFDKPSIFVILGILNVAVLAYALVVRNSPKQQHETGATVTD